VLSPFGVRQCLASAHTDCLINLLKSGGNRAFLPGCEAAYLTLFASGVKHLFSLSSCCPSRPVLAWRRSVVAHYREFYGADNSFFEFLFRSWFFSSKRGNNQQEDDF
ncbi:hypothetical protein, partial [Xenorhabdus sp. IM139775]|uniref:hypothetical protein n=1 Tax=Xenorhabdus sp. IM139775 TaxID=3025876 RepID=UPI0023584D31